MAFDFEREIKTSAITVMVKNVTGKPAYVNRQDTYNEILLDEDQIRATQDYLMRLMEAEPGDVRIDIKQILIPVVWRKYWPLLIGIPGGLIFLGFVFPKMFKRKK